MCLDDLVDGGVLVSVSPGLSMGGESPPRDAISSVDPTPVGGIRLDAVG